MAVWRKVVIGAALAGLAGCSAPPRVPPPVGALIVPGKTTYAEAVRMLGEPDGANTENLGTRFADFTAYAAKDRETHTLRNAVAVVEGQGPSAGHETRQLVFNGKDVFEGSFQADYSWSTAPLDARTLLPVLPPGPDGKPAKPLAPVVLPPSADGGL